MQLKRKDHRIVRERNISSISVLEDTLKIEKRVERKRLHYLAFADDIITLANSMETPIVLSG